MLQTYNALNIKGKAIDGYRLKNSLYDKLQIDANHLIDVNRHKF